MHNEDAFLGSAELQANLIDRHREGAEVDDSYGKRPVMRATANNR